MASDYSDSMTKVVAELGHVVVDVSLSNGLSLLSAALSSIQSRRGEAETILYRLAELNPEVGAQFQPKEDLFAELQLRVISTQRPSSGEISSFIVVSYCWHYPEWKMAEAAHPIAPGWEVSLPMIEAVMGLRSDPDEGVWLDKLCINQEDTREKKVHIGAMDTIYRSARRVIILLEDVQFTEEEEKAGLVYAGFYQDLTREVVGVEDKRTFMREYFPRREKELQSETGTDISAAASRFCSRVLGGRWFSRAWCAHESRVAPHMKINNPLFLCYGYDGRVLPFEFRCINYISMYLCDSEPQVQRTGTEISDAMNDPEPESLQQRWWRILRLVPESLSDISMMQHLVSILSFQCCHKQDLIAIALNTSGIPLSFTGNLSAVEDIIWTFSILVLACNDMTPFFMDGTKLRIRNASNDAFQVSWVVRPLQGVVDHIPESTTTPFPQSITGATQDYVELDLLVFNEPPRAATSESLQLASKIVEEYHLLDYSKELLAAADETIQNSVGLVKGEFERAGGNAGVLERLVPLWIAIALDCGLEWTLRFPELMREATQETWLHGTLGDATDPRLTEASKSLLAHFPASEDNPDKETIDIQRLVKSFTCLLDPRLVLLTAGPRYLATGRGDFGIIQAISNRSWVAVPVAIAHLPAWVPRAWVIEPFDPSSEPENPHDHLVDLEKKVDVDAKPEDVYPILTSDSKDLREQPNEKGTWRLRKRHILFGSRPWNTLPAVDNSSGILLRKQRVYGSEDYDWKAIHSAIRKFESMHPPQA
ncbi:unnamed protein product [Clonostachys byssicola]|uniref:Heterokaryon incompatibility domain-containing protein n=1 Tax=Clonostachys byssicola TaxID=160290 RepID=A0A9N9U6L3_9HYPO|nr:unnamed protein product [Clonostachys byssicola]